MTLHRHKVDGGAHPGSIFDDRVNDGDQPLVVPAGWQIADGSADDVRVCGDHPWQSACLVFANGDIYGTALGKPSRRGKKLDSGALVQDAKGVRTSGSAYDVLLRKRA
jgi:hypothetical protein